MGLLTFQTPTGRLVGPDLDYYYPGEAVTALYAWDWQDLNLLIFNHGAFWADWLSDWLFPIVSGTATQVGVVRGEVAALGRQLDTAENRILNAIAGGSGEDPTLIFQGLQGIINELRGDTFTLDSRLYESAGFIGSLLQYSLQSLGFDVRTAAQEVAGPLRDALATFLANLEPILATATEDFTGDREELEPALDAVEAGQGGAWTALLPIFSRALVYALQTAGPIVAMSLGKEVLEHFPRLRRLLGNIGVEFGQGLVAGIETLHGPMRATMGALATLFFGELERDLASLGEAHEGNVLDVATRMLGTAASLGASAHLASLAAENIAPLKYMGFGQFGAFLADLAGFEGIARNSIGVQMETALREPARRRANRIHRPALPDKATMEQMFLERRIAPEELADFYRTQGWPEAFISPWLATLPIEATPRDIAIVFEDADIDPLWAEDHLRQRGFSDEDAFKIREGLRTRAVKSQRGQAVGALVANYADGLLEEDLLVAALRQLRFSDDAIQLILLSAQHRRVNQEAEGLRRLTEDAAAIGAVSIADLGANLAAFGYDERAQQLAMSRARLRLGIRLFREEEADIKSAVRKAQQDSITAALELFRRFQLDAAGLASYLWQVGVSDDEVEALVALAAARRRPVPRLPEVLTPEAELQEATRIEADRILELTRKGLLDEAVAASSLMALGLEPRRARAEAALAAARRLPPAAVLRPPSLEEIRDARQRALADAAVARFRGGLLSSGGLDSALRSAGIAPEVASAITQREVARAAAEAAREAQDLIERQLREERDAQERAAVQAFRSWRIDAGGLLQALVALGIPRATAQAIVDREMLVRPPRPAPTRS